MNTWAKKLVCGFLTVLIMGTALFPSSSVSAQTGNGTATIDQTVTNTAQQTLVQTGSGYQETTTSLPLCSMVPWWGDGTFEGCMVRLFYYVFLYPSAWIAGIAGQVFDYFIAYTLNSESYQSGGFVEKGWKVVRDLANASFIFVLLYIAITFVLNQKSQGAIKLLTRVIMIAIVINFSLFMTRIIIDAGNIMARVFYEKIIIPNDDNEAFTNYKTLSAGILGYVNPQTLLHSNMFAQQNQSTLQEYTINQNTLGSLSSDGNAANSSVSGTQVSSGFIILILLIASAINLILAWIFFSVSIFFIGRTVGLWIMMVMSPIAFASISIPVLGKKMKRFGFDDWLKETVELSFMAVIFMFFLFLTIMFLDISFETVFDILTQGSTIQKIIKVVIPFSAVAFLLITSKNMAKSMSGDFGSMVGKALKYTVLGALGAAGLGLGAAAGVGAIAGRQVLGRAGAALSRNANTSTARGRIQRRLGNRMSRANYDARNINIPQPVTRTLRSGLSYATDGAVGAGDFRMTQMNTLTGRPDSRGYTQRREDYIRRRTQQAQEISPDERTNIGFTRTVTGQNGVQLVVPVRTSVEEARRNYNRRRAEISQQHNYEAEVVASDRAQQALSQAQRDFEIARQQDQVNSTAATQAALAASQNALNNARNDFQTARATVSNIEGMWRDERDLLNTATERLRTMREETYRNYADSIRDWNRTGITGRGEANRASADSIEDLSYRNN